MKPRVQNDKAKAEDSSVHVNDWNHSWSGNGDWAERAIERLAGKSRSEEPIPPSLIDDDLLLRASAWTTEKIRQEKQVADVRELQEKVDKLSMVVAEYEPPAKSRKERGKTNPARGTFLKARRERARVTRKQLLLKVQTGEDPTFNDPKTISNIERGGGSLKTISAYITALNHFEKKNRLLPTTIDEVPAG
jgi:hypothetical protein